MIVLRQVQSLTSKTSSAVWWVPKLKTSLNSSRERSPSSPAADVNCSTWRRRDVTEGSWKVEGSCQMHQDAQRSRRAAACAQTHQLDGSLHQGGMLRTVRSTGVAIRNRRHRSSLCLSVCDRGQLFGIALSSYYGLGSRTTWPTKERRL